MAEFPQLSSKAIENGAKRMITALEHIHKLEFVVGLLVFGLLLHVILVALGNLSVWLLCAAHGRQDGQHIRRHARQLVSGRLWLCVQVRWGSL